MAEERRSAARARIAGVRVTYESAAEDHVETDALNLGAGGLFVRSARPLAVGKRISLEIQVAGELVPWSALGRVVWAREREEGNLRPAGMGIKLIDVEDSVIATIERLVADREPGEPEVAAPVMAREPTARGVGPPEAIAASSAGALGAPSRERTILGVGIATPVEPLAVGAEDEPSMVPSVAVATPAVATPAMASLPLAPNSAQASGKAVTSPPIATAGSSSAEASPPREPSQPRSSGVGFKPAAAREPSVVIDLVGRDHGAPAKNDDVVIRNADVSATLRGQRLARDSSRSTASRDAPSSEPPPFAGRGRRRAGIVWVIALVVLAIAAAVVYVIADGDVMRFVRSPELGGTASGPVPPPAPSPVLTARVPTVTIPPSSPSSTPTASANAPPSISAAPASPAPPSASVAPRRLPPMAPPSARPAPGQAEAPVKRPATPPPDNPY